MHPGSSRSALPEGTEPDSDHAIALVHFLLKEIEWIRKLSSRLHRRDREQGRHERDLECILELSGSVAQAMRRFLDEARCAESRAADLVEVGSLLEEAVLQVARRSAGPAIRVGVDETARGAKVPAQLRVALVAVLENAVDFSAAAQPVVVRARAHADALDICVEDCGSGMEEHVVSSCRARGFTTRAGRGGHGFGLYAASRILARSQGELTVESKPGKGTRVLLRLPNPPSEGSSRATAPPRGPASDRARHRPPGGSTC